MLCPECGCATRVFHTKNIDSAMVQRTRVCEGPETHRLLTEETLVRVLRGPVERRAGIAEALAWGETPDQIVQRLLVTPEEVESVRAALALFPRRT